MHSSTDLPLDRPSRPAYRSAAPWSRTGRRWAACPAPGAASAGGLPPAVDLLSSSVALLAVALAAGAKVFPALPLAPLLLLVVYGALGVYGALTARRPRRRGRHGLAGDPPPRRRPLRLVGLADDPARRRRPAGALGRLRGSSTPPPAAFSSPLLRRFDSVERWVLVGDEATAARLKAYEPLRAYATVVATVPPDDEDDDRGRGPRRRPRGRRPLPRRPRRDRAPGMPTTRACSISSAPSSRSACRSASCPAPSTCSRRPPRRRARSAACP